MKKSQIIEMIINIAKELAESNVAMNQEEKKIVNKINHQGKYGIESLNEQEIDYTINILFLSNHYSTEEIDDCIDLLQEHAR